MSLILDALNRSRQESDSVPGIATEHVMAPPDKLGLRQYLPWVALAFALVVILWLLLDREGEPVEVTVAPAPMAETGIATSGTQDTALAGLSDNLGSALTSVRSELQARAAAANESGSSQNQTGKVDESANTGNAASSATRAQPGVPAQPTGVSQNSVAVLPAPMTAPIATSRQSTPERMPPDDTAVQAIYKAQAEALYAQPPASAESGGQAMAQSQADTQVSAEPVANPAVREDPVDIERILLKAREEMKDARLVEHEAPFLATLSQQSKDEIPTILYQRHDYSTGGRQSTVVLNGSSLQAGAETRGVKVEEILPDSVVLNYRGVVFRLRALNSWVNL